MSPLTKIFVGLLVLLSVAFTAGVVTFINQLAPLKTNNVALDERAKAAESRVSDLQTRLAAAAADVTAANVARQDEASKLTAEKAAVQRMLDDKNAQLAKAGNDLVLANANISRMTSALSASEETKGKLNDQMVALRNRFDDVQKQNVESSNAISTLTRTVDVTERQRRNLAEQVTELTNVNKKQVGLLKDAGITEAMIATKSGGTGNGAPALNGVIRDRKTIAGKEYATISLGSEDSVIKGMQFKILEKGSGRFLGVLTVDEVDSNEAIGRIESDNTAAIKAGAEVRTQV